MCRCSQLCIMQCDSFHLHGWDFLVEGILYLCICMYGEHTLAYQEYLGVYR